MAKLHHQNMKIKVFSLCLRITDHYQERDVRNALRDLENLDKEEQ
jgi:hypothetical protein